MPNYKEGVDLTHESLEALVKEILSIREIADIPILRELQSATDSPYYTAGVDPATGWTDWSEIRCYRMPSMAEIVMDTQADLEAEMDALESLVAGRSLWKEYFGEFTDLVQGADGVWAVPTE